MEAILLAGGKGERLRDAAAGKPKPLVRVRDRPLAAYQIALLARAGVERVIVSCAAGDGPLFLEELAGLGVEIVVAEEAEPLGRGGGLRFAARRRRESGPVFALNGDDLLAVDLTALLARHRARRPAATVTVARPPAPARWVELAGDGAVSRFADDAVLPYWANCGVYVLDEEALADLPQRGDHETTSFPALASRERLYAFRYEGPWLPVNTPDDLRRAEEYVAANPDWLPRS